MSTERVSLHYGYICIFLQAVSLGVHPKMITAALLNNELCILTVNMVILLNLRGSHSSSF